MAVADGTVVVTDVLFAAVFSATVVIGGAVVPTGFVPAGADVVVAIWFAVESLGIVLFCTAVLVWSVVVAVAWAVVFTRLFVLS